jgi:hypothetical protein
MTLLNKNSLAQTIDNVNEAFFYGKKISKSEANDVTKWIATRLDTEYSYSGSFGLTAKDMRSKNYTFTGEALTSPASLRHIMAEEASRIILQLSQITGKKPPALDESNKRLIRCIKYSESIGKPEGTFCCGPCTVGLWRHLTAGGLGSYSKKLPKGIEILERFKDGKGSWGRFPFYYTLLALSDVNHPAAKREIEYALPLVEKRLIRLKPNGKFSKRRRDLLLKIINNS